MCLHGGAHLPRARGAAIVVCVCVLSHSVHKSARRPLVCARRPRTYAPCLCLRPAKRRVRRPQVRVPPVGACTIVCVLVRVVCRKGVIVYVLVRVVRPCRGAWGQLAPTGTGAPTLARVGPIVMVVSGLLFLAGGQPVGPVLFSVDAVTWEVAPSHMQSNGAAQREFASAVVRACAGSQLVATCPPRTRVPAHARSHSSFCTRGSASAVVAWRCAVCVCRLRCVQYVQCVRSRRHPLPNRPPLPTRSFFLRTVGPTS
jgi:hypothetical protein